MRIRSAALLAMALALPACGSCAKGSPSAAEGGVAAPLPPVPVPPGLLAQAWIRSPDALWSRVQLGVSGAIALLPGDVGALAAAAAGLDASVGPLVDGKATAFAVVADGAIGQPPAWAMALPLKDPARAAILLLEGDAARYAGHDVGGMTALARTGRTLSAAVAIAGGWLLLASTEADLARLGPYASRTMPGLPSPASPAAVVVEVGRDALAGSLSTRLRALWTQARGELSARDVADRARHAGRAPDFGDPQAILAALDPIVERRAALVEGATSARIEVDADEDAVHADLTLDPGAAQAPLVAAMTPGDARPLLDVPVDAVAAVLLRDDAAARRSDAAELEAALGHAFAPRASADDTRALAAALDDWASSRGDWMTASLAWGTARGVLVRVPGGAAAARAVRETVDLARRPLFAEPLRSALALGPPVVSSPGVAGVVDPFVAAFPGRKGEALGVAWGLHDGATLAATGEQAPALLATLAAPPARLGDEPRVARAIGAVGDRATFALLAEPLRLSAVRAGSDAARAPAVIAYGRRDGSVWARVDVAGELLREVIRSQAGL